MTASAPSAAAIPHAGRTPTACHADREHDRERLDHLHRGRQERGGEEQERVHDSALSESWFVAYTTRMAADCSKCYRRPRGAGRQRASASPRPSGGSPKDCSSSGPKRRAAVGGRDRRAPRHERRDGRADRQGARLRRARRAAARAGRRGPPNRRSASGCAGPSSRRRREELLAAAIDRPPRRARRAQPRRVRPTVSRCGRPCSREPARSCGAASARRRTSRRTAEMLSQRIGKPSIALVHTGTVIRRRAPRRFGRRRGRRVRVRPAAVARACAARPCRARRCSRRVGHRHARPSARRACTRRCECGPGHTGTLREPRRDARRASRRLCWRSRRPTVPYPMLRSSC